jgi:hypothetical protein
MRPMGSGVRRSCPTRINALASETRCCPYRSVLGFVRGAISLPKACPRRVTATRTPPPAGKTEVATGIVPDQWVKFLYRLLRIAVARGGSEHRAYKEQGDAVSAASQL